MTKQIHDLKQVRLESVRVFQALQKVIPGGVNSPVRAWKGIDQVPLIVDKAYEDMLVDVDGNEYIDFCMSWGSHIHGHQHPQIIQAVQEQLKKGTSYGCTTEIEEKIAKKVQELVPSCEKVRFVSSGTEATMTAVRLARGFTGKKIIVKFAGNYHGHADQFLVQAGSGVLDINRAATSKGVPEDFLRWTFNLPYNDIDTFLAFISQKEVQDNLAGVIVEPIACNMGVVFGTDAFLQTLRNKTKELGAVLIFDEVITGFREACGGMQSICNIQPDLTTLGKIVGGGFPAAAFGGRKEIMDQLAPIGEVYQAGTLSGNPIAMCAGLVALNLLDQKDFYKKLKIKTDRFLDPIQEYIQKKNLPCVLNRGDSFFTLFFGKKSVQSLDDVLQCDTKRFFDFFLYLFERGIYFSPSQFEACFLSSAHSEEHLQKTQDAVLQYLAGM